MAESESNAPEVSVGVEMTGPQVAHLPGDLSDPKLPKDSPTYKAYRELRKHPTAALCRLFITAPIIAANWSYETRDDDVPEEWVDYVTEAFTPVRDTFIETAVLGMIDFGWQPFEVVWDHLDSGLVGITKLKDLLQDNTDILVNMETGAFEGFRQKKSGNDVDIFGDNALLLNIGVEGTNWDGEGRLDVAKGPITEWLESNAGAKLYDSKIAGAHWQIKYPPGKTPWGSSGEETDNYDIAVAILNDLTASGKFLVPSGVSAFIEDAGARNPNEGGWDISIISDSSARQYSFTNRLIYLDKLICRAMGLPERAILEASMGTRADAGTHAQAAATTFDLMHRGIVADLNKGCVDPGLIMNFGEEAKGAVYISPAPITDVSVTFLQEVYKEFLKDANIRAAEYDDMDKTALRDKVDVPHEGEDLEGELGGVNNGAESSEGNAGGDSGGGVVTGPAGPGANVSTAA
jgi:hypothetical protein